MTEQQQADLRALQELLDYQHGVLENYQMDLESAGLVKQGFCQGRIYLNALPKCEMAQEIVERLLAQAEKPISRDPARTATK